MSVICGAGAFVHESVKSYGFNRVGDRTMLMENVVLGYPTSDIFVRIRDGLVRIEDLDYEGCRIGANCILRAGVAVYKDTEIGDDVRTGHNVLVRERCRIGHNVLLGTNVVVDNETVIGNHVSVQSSVYIPTGTVIGNRVFLGPNCVLLNDRYPVRNAGTPLRSPVLRDGASIGGNATLLPGVVVGEGALVAASAVVTRDVPPWHLAQGSPARFSPLPDELRTPNAII